MEQSHQIEADLVMDVSAGKMVNLYMISMAFLIIVALLVVVSIVLVLVLELIQQITSTIEESLHRCVFTAMTFGTPTSMLTGTSRLPRGAIAYSLSCSPLRVFLQVPL